MGEISPFQETLNVRNPKYIAAAVAIAAVLGAGYGATAIWNRGWAARV